MTSNKEAENKGDDSEGASGFYRNAVIVAALAVAGGYVVYKNFYKH